MGGVYHIALTVALLAGCKRPPRSAPQGAADRVAQVRAGILAEDAERGGEPRRAVEAALAERLATAERALAGADPAAAGRAAAELEAAYLATTLDSSDARQQPGEWTADDGRDVLGAPGVDDKLRAWSTHPRGFIKFAVVGTPRGLAFRVGSASVRHVDLAGGSALTAGILRVELEPGARPLVKELENTSGGFRPGPLRNRIARVALKNAGYAAPELVVYDNPTGDYATSRLAPDSGMHK